LTLSAWVKTSSLSALQVIFSNSRDCCGSYKGYQINITSTGTIRFVIWKSDMNPIALNSSITPDLNSWTLLTVTFDEAMMKIYKNGVFGGQQALSGSIGVPASFPMKIGSLAHTPA